MTPKNKLKLISRNCVIDFMKKGNKIHIKKSNQGKFTDYCGGTVTDECIQKGKNSSDPKIRKRATFAENARKWKHQYGGTLSDLNNVHRNENIGTDLSDKRYDQKALLQYQDWYKSYNEYLKKKKREELQQKNISNVTSNLTKEFIETGNTIVDKRASKPSKYGQPIKENAADSQIGISMRADAPIAQVQNTIEEQNRRKELQKMLEQEQLQTAPENPIMDIITPIYNQTFQQQTPFLVPQNMKKGGKTLIKNPKVHKPFGHTSILDDVGKVNPKTLKLK